MKKTPHKKTKSGAAKPEVGIFFLVGSELLVERTALVEAGTYADCKIHEGDHINYWEKLLRARAVPESEYDEHPRGRVVFNIRTGQFMVYADKCILGRKALVATIKSELQLPKDTKTAPDSHYRCPRCLGAKGPSAEAL
jgi:hypothetical protein